MSDYLPDDYTPVHERIKEFRKDYPKGRIATEIFKWQDDMGVFRASVSDKDGNVLGWGTGHATRESDKFVGEKFYEKGETVAVGRALAFAGYGIEKGIASQEEVKSSQQSKSKSKPTKEDKFYQRDRMSTNEGTVTNNQTKAIFAILKDRYDFHTEKADDWVGYYKSKYIEDLSKKEASNLIDMLKNNEDKADKMVEKYKDDMEDNK